MIDLNATQAAVRAGYSKRTAEVQGPRLLGNVRVAQAIASATTARSQRTAFTADEVLRELAALIRTNPSHFTVDDDGRMVLADESSAEPWRAVASVKQKTRIIPQKNGEEPIVEREVEYRQWDKNAAIEKAMKHLGLLEDQVRHVGDGMRFSFEIDRPAAVNGNGHR